MDIKDTRGQIRISLTRGARVWVKGRLKQRSFETKEGEKRTVVELDVDEIGPSLRCATAKVNKVSRSTSSGASSAGASSEDPWGSAPPRAAAAASPTSLRSDL